MLLATNVTSASARHDDSQSEHDGCRGDVQRRQHGHADLQQSGRRATIINVSGTGFSPGALASIVECNSDPAQPVILFLGNDIPVSCSRWPS